MSETREWVMRRGTLVLDAPLVVGILNLTPDSFSDGGRYTEVSDAIAHVEALLGGGAGMLDLGAESTRPGAGPPISANEEWSRLEPTLTAVISRFPDIPISVDTVRSETGRRALRAGAWALNDVSGLRLDPEIAVVCAEFGAGLILSHSRGKFQELASYQHACYDDVVDEVRCELGDSVAAAVSVGVKRTALVLDPGLGFAKRPEHNYALLRGLSGLSGLGLPVMVGPSRKRFLSYQSEVSVSERDNATAAACVVAYERGARIFRVHDVGRVRGALIVARAVEEA